MDVRRSLALLAVLGLTAACSGGTSRAFSATGAAAQGMHKIEHVSW